MTLRNAEPDEPGRWPLLNRPTNGKTARKRRFPPKGRKTNVGNPNDTGSQKKIA